MDNRKVVFRLCGCCECNSFNGEIIMVEIGSCDYLYRIAIKHRRRNGMKELILSLAIVTGLALFLAPYLYFIATSFAKIAEVLAR